MEEPNTEDLASSSTASSAQPSRLMSRDFESETDGAADLLLLSGDGGKEVSAAASASATPEPSASAEPPRKEAEAEDAEARLSTGSRTARSAAGKRNKPFVGGWLQKLGAKGLVKTWKQRWFILDPIQCRMFYYRTVNSDVPLGNIDVAISTLSIHVVDAGPGPAAGGNSTAAGAAVPTSLLTQTQFIVSTPNRVFHLQADSPKDMNTWLNVLQDRRHDFIERHGQGVLKHRSEHQQSSARSLKAPSYDTSALLMIGSISPSSTTSSNILTSTGYVFKKLMGGGGSSSNSSSNTSGHAHSSAAHAQPTSPTAASREDASEAGSIEDSTRRRSFLRRAFTRASNASVASVPGSPEGVNPSISAADAEKRALQREIEDLQERIRFLEDEARAKDTLVRDSLSTEEERTQLLMAQAKQILELQRELALTSDERDEHLSNFDNIRNAYNESIHKRDMLLEENLAIKELSEDLHRELNAIRGIRSDGSAASSHDGRTQDSLIETLRIKTDAYERQNAFLNNEVVQMVVQRQKDDELYQEVVAKVEAMEKQLAELRVQRVELLKIASDETSKSKERVKEMIAKALQDGGLSGTVGGAAAEAETYDRHGFKTKIDLDASLRALSPSGTQADETANKAKWEQYFDLRKDREFSRDVKDFMPPESLKNLVRGGIHHDFRREMWAEMIRDWTKAQQRFQGKDYFHRILEHKEQKTSTATKQIELDLPRTFPTHKDFCDLECEGIAKLRRVLVAFSWHNPVIGYCQGMNMMAALLLLVLDEEMAFWGLIAVVEHILPKAYYGQGMLGALADQRVLRDLVSERLPKLSRHLEMHNIDLSLVSFNWLLTVFIDGFPPETSLRIWDSFLFEGAKVPFRFALAILKHHEAHVLKMDDRLKIFSYLKACSKKLNEVDAVSKLAYHDGWTGFSMAQINERRLHRNAEVKQELEEMDRSRAEYLKSKSTGQSRE